MRFLSYALVFLTAGLLATYNASGNPLRGATLTWEPYMGATMPREGYVVEVVREAFRAGGEYSLDIEYMAWAWVVALAGSGKYDFYFPEYEDPKLHEKFFFSDPIPGGPLVFFRKKNKPFTYKSLQDLKPYKIGVVRGYVNTPEFDAADFLTKVEAITDTENLGRLLDGKIDILVMDQYVGLNLLRTQWPDRFHEVAVADPPLEKKQLFVCFPKNKTDAEAHMNAFNRGLQILSDSGRLREIMASHGF